MRIERAHVETYRSGPSEMKPNPNRLVVQIETVPFNGEVPLDGETVARQLWLMSSVAPDDPAAQKATLLHVAKALSDVEELRGLVAEVLAGVAEPGVWNPRARRVLGLVESEVDEPSIAQSGLVPGGSCRRRVPAGMKTWEEAQVQRERVRRHLQTARVQVYSDRQYVASGWYVLVAINATFDSPGDVLARLVSKEETDRFLEGYVSTSTAPHTS